MTFIETKGINASSTVSIGKFILDAISVSESFFAPFGKFLELVERLSILDRFSTPLFFDRGRLDSVFEISSPIFYNVLVESVYLTEELKPIAGIGRMLSEVVNVVEGSITFDFVIRIYNSIQTHDLLTIPIFGVLMESIYLAEWDLSKSIATKYADAVGVVIESLPIEISKVLQSNVAVAENFVRNLFKNLTLTDYVGILESAISAGKYLAIYLLDGIMTLSEVNKNINSILLDYSSPADIPLPFGYGITLNELIVLSEAFGFNKFVILNEILNANGSITKGAMRVLRQLTILLDKT